MGYGRYKEPTDKNKKTPTKPTRNNYSVNHICEDYAEPVPIRAPVTQKSNDTSKKKLVPPSYIQIRKFDYKSQQNTEETPWVILPDGQFLNVVSLISKQVIPIAKFAGVMIELGGISPQMIDKQHFTMKNLISNFAEFCDDEAQNINLNSEFNTKEWPITSIICCTIINFLCKDIFKLVGTTNEEDIKAICLGDQKSQERLIRNIYENLEQGVAVEFRGIVKSTMERLHNIIYGTLKLEALCRMTYPRYMVCYESIGGYIPKVNSYHQIILDGLELERGRCIILYPGVLSEEDFRCPSFVLSG